MVEIRALKEEDRGHVRALELFCVREYLESALKKNWDSLSQELIDQLGFDAVDDGGLADSWRQQPGTPVYGADADADGVRKALAAARPERGSEWRA